MKNRSTLFVAAIVLMPNLANADVVPANWWSNQTSSSGIVEQGTEGLRMTTGFNTGFVAGTVDALPGTQWLINFHVSTDNDVELPNEFVDVFVDGNFVNRVYNSPTGTSYLFDYALTGDSFDYRFEFSSPSTEITDHLIVRPGTITSVPEPGGVAAFAVVTLVGLVSAAGRRRIRYALRGRHNRFAS